MTEEPLRPAPDCSWLRFEHLGASRRHNARYLAEQDEYWAARTWRRDMHPDDRTWLAAVEGPLLALGFRPPAEPVLPDPGVAERR